MKIIEGIKHKGNPYCIPDCTRDDFPEFLREMGYKVGAEIGVYRGLYSRQLLAEGLKLYLIDPWLPYDDYISAGGNNPVMMNTVYQDTLNNIKEFTNYEIIKKTSMDALKDIPDGSLDFVYIDANHGFKYIAEDLYEWEKKARRGGVVSGHDYFNRLFSSRNEAIQVGVVVDAYVSLKELKSWYLIGEKPAKDGEKADRYRTWFWIKK